MKTKEESENDINALVRIANVCNGAIDDLNESDAPSRAATVNGALRAVARILINYGVDDGFTASGCCAARRAALRRLEELFEHFWKVDGLELASGRETFEMCASLVSEANTVILRTHDEFGVDPAREARRAEEQGGVPFADKFGAKLVDGAAAEEDAPIAAAAVGHEAKRGEIRALGFVFALEFVHVALKFCNLRFCGGKFGAGGYEGADREIAALKELENWLTEAENGVESGQDVHDVLFRYVALKGKELFR